MFDDARCFGFGVGFGLGVLSCLWALSCGFCLRRLRVCCGLTVLVCYAGGFCYLLLVRVLCLHVLRVGFLVLLMWVLLWVCLFVLFSGCVCDCFLAVVC